jgi:hypothetical protein
MVQPLIQLVTATFVPPFREAHERGDRVLAGTGCQILENLENGSDAMLGAGTGGAVTLPVACAPLSPAVDARVGT